MNFEEKVKAIEDAAMQIVDEGMPYVKTVATYGGELSDLNSSQSRENLKDLLKQRALTFPLVLVAYAGGVPALGNEPLVFDEPREIQHRFTLVLVACDNNTRGEVVRRRGQETTNPAGRSYGTLKMVSDIYDLFTARQLLRRIDDVDVILNEGELVPLQDGFIERVPGITAQAVPFNGTFNFISAGQEQPPPGAIDLINFGIDPINGQRGATGRPGVAINEKE
jgi:hypothetical protein